MLSLERSKSLYLTPNKGTAELERDDACGGFDYSTQRWISLTSDSVNTPSKDAISVQVTDDGVPLPPISSKYQRVNVTYDRVSSTKDRFDNLCASTDDRDRIISSFHDQVPAGGGDEEEQEEEDEVGPSSSQPAAHDSSQHMTDVPFKMDDATLLRFQHERLSAVSSDTDFIANIFLFGRPQLLFEFLQIVVIALSLYVSLWITNYAFLPIPGWLKVIALCRAALSLCCDRSSLPQCNQCAVVRGLPAVCWLRVQLRCGCQVGGLTEGNTVCLLTLLMMEGRKEDELTTYHLNDDTSRLSKWTESWYWRYWKR